MPHPVHTPILAWRESLDNTLRAEVHTKVVLDPLRLRHGLEQFKLHALEVRQQGAFQLLHLFPAVRAGEQRGRQELLVEDEKSEVDLAQHRVLRAVSEVVVYRRPGRICLELDGTKLGIEVGDFDDDVKRYRLDGCWGVDVLPEQRIKTGWHLAEERHAGVVDV